LGDTGTSTLENDLLSLQRKETDLKTAILITKLIFICP
jgi:hypothetical protein